MQYDTAEHDRLRKMLKAYYAYCDCLEHKFRKEHSIPDDVESWMLSLDGLRLPPFPKALRGLTCGAKTRKGTPCKNKDIWRNGRCKFHGGLSTGPKTPEGKAKVAENGRKSAKARQPKAG